MGRVLKEAVSDRRGEETSGRADAGSGDPRTGRGWQTGMTAPRVENRAQRRLERHFFAFFEVQRGDVAALYVE